MKSHIYRMFPRFILFLLLILSVFPGLIKPIHAQNGFIILQQGDSLIGNPRLILTNRGATVGFTPVNQEAEIIFQAVEVLEFVEESGSRFHRVYQPEKTQITGYSFATVLGRGELSLLRIGTNLYLMGSSGWVKILENTDSLVSLPMTGTGQGSYSKSNKEYVTVLSDAFLRCQNLSLEITSGKRTVDLTSESLLDLLVDYHKCVGVPFTVTETQPKEVARKQWTISALGGIQWWSLDNLQLKGSGFQYLRPTFLPTYGASIGRRIRSNKINPNLSYLAELQLLFGEVRMTGVGLLYAPDEVRDSLDLKFIFAQIPIGISISNPEIPGNPYLLAGLLFQMTAQREVSRFTRTYPLVYLQNGGPRTDDEVYPINKAPKLGPWFGVGIGVIDGLGLLEARIQLLGTEFEGFSGGSAWQFFAKFSLLL